MHDILNMARKVVDEAEIFWVKGKEFPVAFKANKFYTAEKKDFEGIGIRVIKKGRLGFAYTTNMKTVKDIIEYAKNSAEFGEPAHFEFPSEIRSKSVRTYCKSIDKISTEEVKEKGLSIIREIIKKEPDVKVEIKFSRSTGTVRIMNTKGLNISYKKTSVSTYMDIFLIIDGSFNWFFKMKTSQKKIFINKMDVKELLKNIRYAKKVVPIEPGKMNVIIMPSVMPVLLRSLTMGVNGKLVQKGSSPLKDKKGKRILDKNVSIYDDALLKDGIASRPFDDEGIATKKIPLFKNGILKNFLFDLQTAGIMGTRSTGSATRSYSEMPSPGVSNIVVDPGDWSVQDMIKDINDGIIVYAALGGGQSNLLAGDFSFNVSLGFKIENGRIKGRVKNTMIAGNVYDAMSNIAGIGKRLEGVRSFYIPAFYFKSLNVVG